jgi:hypothetical protein
MTHVDPNAPELGKFITAPAARKAIYATFGIVAFLAFLLTVGFATAGDIPLWLTIANSVIAAAGGPIGGLAVANTPKADG